MAKTEPTVTACFHILVVVDSVLELELILCQGVEIFQLRGVTTETVAYWKIGTKFFQSIGEFFEE